ncbi:MAG TPA: RsmE family RNA methyltransferase [Acidimicrobiales bacterium]
MATPVTARAHAFVDDLDAPVLSADDQRHFLRVLRLPLGSYITVSDGHGTWRTCRLTSDPSLTVHGETVKDPAPNPPITVAFALVKGERPELVVQKLTELGVDRIVPFVADRSVVRWDAPKAERQTARLAQIARQAAMQSRRTRLPEVGPMRTFHGAATLDGAALADPDGAPPTLERPAVLVGPEGGWSPEERSAGLPSIRLGPHVLRAETAAITAGALLAALRDGLVAHADSAR